MDNPSPHVCTATTRAGKPCRAVAAFDSTTCFMHSDRSKSAQIAGGKTRGKPKEPIEKPDLSTPELQRRFIELTIHQVQNNLLPLSVGRFTVYAASVARQVGDDEIVKRLEALESTNGIE
jgi:hypothetical protein